MRYMQVILLVLMTMGYLMLIEWLSYLGWLRDPADSPVYSK